MGLCWKLKSYSLSPATVTQQLLCFCVKECGGSGGGKAVNTELWAGMLLLSEHASSFSYERPLKDDGMLTTPPGATVAPLFRPLTRAGATVSSIKITGGF